LLQNALVPKVSLGTHLPETRLRLLRADLSASSACRARGFDAELGTEEIRHTVGDARCRVGQARLGERRPTILRSLCKDEVNWSNLVRATGGTAFNYSSVRPCGCRLIFGARAMSMHATNDRHLEKIGGTWRTGSPLRVCLQTGRMMVGRRPRRPCPTLRNRVPNRDL
jgi:hypothetical protein